MIGVIADDLTGAAEIGAVGLRHGLQAQVVLPGAANSENKFPKADLISVDTDSRSCVPEEAARRVRSATKRLLDAGARWLYKKTDSILRGPVAAELAAMRDELRANRVVLVPANPALDRIIRDGRYFVGGKLIHETEFARDPEYPRTSPDVIQLLGAAPDVPVSVCRAHDSLPAGGIIIGEAATTGDLQEWAKRREPGTLCAGGSGFFGALLAAAGHAESSAPRVAIGPEDRALFVCGTLSESARDFLKAARERGTPLFTLPAELAGGAEFKEEVALRLAGQVASALESQRQVILAVGLPLVREPSIAHRLATHLVRVAGHVLRQRPVRHVYAEGGATSVALARHMGWDCFQVVEELAFGVATLAPAGNASTWLTIKPGSYVWPAEVQVGLAQ